MTHKFLIACVVAASFIAATAPANAYTGQALERSAHVSMVQATAIALHARPGRMTARELEREHGGSGLRYSFDIRSRGQVYEVGVDASDGRVLENQREGSHPD